MKRAAWGRKRPAGPSEARPATGVVPASSASRMNRPTVSRSPACSSGSGTACHSPSVGTPRAMSWSSMGCTSVAERGCLAGLVGRTVDHDAREATGGGGIDADGQPAQQLDRCLAGGTRCTGVQLEDPGAGIIAEHDGGAAGRRGVVVDAVGSPRVARAALGRVAEELVERTVAEHVRHGFVRSQPPERRPARRRRGRLRRGRQGRASGRAGAGAGAGAGERRASASSSAKMSPGSRPSAMGGPSVHEVVRGARRDRVGRWRVADGGVRDGLEQRLAGAAILGRERVGQELLHVRDGIGLSLAQGELGPSARGRQRRWADPAVSARPAYESPVHTSRPPTPGSSSRGSVDLRVDAGLGRQGQRRERGRPLVGSVDREAGHRPTSAIGRPCVGAQSRLVERTPRSTGRRTSVDLEAGRRSRAAGGGRCGGPAAAPGRRCSSARPAGVSGSSDGNGWLPVLEVERQLVGGRGQQIVGEGGREAQVPQLVVGLVPGLVGLQPGCTRGRAGSRPSTFHRLARAAPRPLVSPTPGRVWHVWLLRA